MLTCLLPNQVDVVSLTEVKAHLRLDHDCEDDYLSMLVRAMQNMIEEYTNKSLLTQTWRLMHHLSSQKRCDECEQCIELPRGPVQEIVSLQRVINGGSRRHKLRHYTVKTHGPVTYIVCSTEHTEVEVVYKAGFGESPHHIPSAIRHAIVLGVGEMYENRHDAFRNTDTLVHALIRPYVTSRMT